MGGGAEFDVLVVIGIFVEFFEAFDGAVDNDLVFGANFSAGGDGEFAFFDDAFLNIDFFDGVVGVDDALFFFVHDDEVGVV